MHSRTTTQFDLMMKTIMVVLFVFGLFVFFVDVTKAVSPYYVDDPNNCPQNYYTLWPGVNLYPQNICGVDPIPAPNGTPQPYYTNTLVKASSNASSASQLSASFGGGYLVNCFADIDLAAPYCDNNGTYWCNSDPSCLSQNRTTTCLLNKWASESSAFSCGDCDSTHLDCNGDAGVCEITKNVSNYPTGTNNHYGNTCNAIDARCDTNYYDCNSTGVTVGDGCEVLRSGSCTISPGLTGTWSCVVDAGGSCTNGGSNYTCTCVPPISNFQTGIESMYSTTSPLLWGKQFGTGDLISFSNATSSNIFVVKNDASVFMSSTLATTTDKYFYRYDGDLYWGDEKLNTGGGVYTAGDGLNLNSYEFSVDTSTNFNWSGQHAFNTTTSFPLGVWGSNGKVGINTTSLIYTFNVQMSPGDVGAYGLFANTGNLLMGFGNARGIDGEPNDTGVIALYYNTSSLSSPSFRFQATGTSWMASNLSIGRNNSGMSGEKLRVWGDFNIDNNGLLKFNGISGSVDQVIKINASGFPEWVDVETLFTNNTIFNSSTEFNSTSTFNSTAIFEGPSYFNNDVFVSGTISSTNLYVNGNSTTTGDLYVLGQAIFHDILPADNLTYTIGTSTLVWKEGWFGKIFTPEIDFTNNWKLSTTTGGGLAFTSSTQVALAMLATGQVGINTTTIEANLKMKVDGNIGSKLYCDVNGNNCFDPNAFGWATPQARYMNTTTANYNGNFGSFPAASGTIGYEAANHICSSTVGVGYHICQANEILDIIRIYGTSTFASKTNGWVANGPPGYVTVSTNDCEGYTTSTVSFYGAWWKFNDSSGGGSGKMTNCSTLQPIACCK